MSYSNNTNNIINPKFALMAVDYKSIRMLRKWILGKAFTKKKHICPNRIKKFSSLLAKPSFANTNNKLTYY